MGPPSIGVPQEPETGDLARTRVWRRVLAWSAAAAILGLLFWKIPLGKVLAALQSADAPFLLLTAALVVAWWFLLESTGLSFCFTRFNLPLSMREAQSVRALSYPLASIHWDLGNGAMLLDLNRAKRIPLLEGLGTLFLWETVGEFVHYLFFLGGVFFLPHPDQLGLLVWIALASILYTVALLAVLRGGWPVWRWLERVRAWPVTRAFRRFTPRDLVILAGLRTAHFAGLVTLLWLGARAFQAEIPLGLAIATSPIVSMAARFPTPAGLGTQQAAIVFFYAPHGGEAAMLAFSLGVPAVLIAGRCLVWALYATGLVQSVRG